MKTFGEYNLKECPICLSNTEDVSLAWDLDKFSFPVYFVTCTCGFEGERFWDIDHMEGVAKQQAIMNWNDRRKIIPEPIFDYENLLRQYIRYVEDSEGTNFIDSCTGYEWEKMFSEVERSELLRLTKD